ncbi:MAG: thioredoxin domain-containing protein [Pirellulales bacterium]|nr:thioredoxin domain-containing protein [Pirellulales bacterium]
MPHVPDLGWYEKNALVRSPVPPPLSRRLVFGELVCFSSDKDVTGGLSAHLTIRVHVLTSKRLGLMESRMFRVFCFIRLFVVFSLVWLSPSIGRCQTTAPATAATTGDVVFLDFSADWCGPCKQMAPLIGEIGAAGWLVRHVDVDQEHDIVKRFQVTGVPCYILLVKGHEVGRIDGATTRSELEKLLAKSRQPLGLPKLAVPSDSPTVNEIPGVPVPVSKSATHLATEPPAAPTLHPPAQLSGAISQPVAGLASERSLRDPQGAKQQQALPPPPTLAVETKSALQRNLIQATARLRVQDPKGASWGTGTVIDCRQGEALILTCGHIFRDSVGEGSIEVDLFGDPSADRLAGQMVSYDLDRDLALVSVFTEAILEPVKIGSVGRSRDVGEGVVTIGCDGGREPTMHVSRVTSVDKYLGPANVQVAGQPVQGRSGGGLFALDGTLLGVCNAADPEDNEGLFAALPSIHEHLDEAGLAFVYRHVYPGTENELAGNADKSTVPHLPDAMPDFSFDRRDRADAVPTASSGPRSPAEGGDPLSVDQNEKQFSTPPLSQAVGDGEQMQSLSTGEQALLDHVREHGGDAEVICIVRPRGASQADSEVFMLQNASPHFVDRLSEVHAQGNVTSK